MFLRMVVCKTASSWKIQFQLIWINFIPWKCNAMNKSRLWSQNSLRQTCNVFVFTFAKHLFKRRDVLHIGCLALNILCTSDSCIEIKIKLNVYFHTSLWCLKSFYEGLNGLHKIFCVAPQRSVKIKI